MTPESRTWTLTGIVLVGLLLSLQFHYKLAYYEGLGYPYNTFLFRPDDAGNDFYNIYGPVRAGSPYGSPTSVYFPFTYFPLYALRFLPGRIALLSLVIIFTSVLGKIVARAVSTLAAEPRVVCTLILTFLTYPYLFCIDRGNLEMMTFLFLAGFVSFLDRDRPLIAALFLAAAAAMKGYPAMFGLIFLARRQFRPFALAAISGTVMTLGSAALYPGGIVRSFLSLRRYLRVFNDLYIAGRGGMHFNPNGMQHNASYFGLARTLELTGTLPYGWVELFQRFYVPFAATIGLLISVWILAFERTLWRQLALITCAVILLPQVSFDYKLILLMFPVVAYLAQDRRSPLDRLWVATFGLLLIPKSYAWIVGDISISVILNPLLLTLLLVLAVTDGVISRSAVAESSRGT